MKVQSFHVVFVLERSPRIVEEFETALARTLYLKQAALYATGTIEVIAVDVIERRAA